MWIWDSRILNDNIEETFSYIKHGLNHGVQRALDYTQFINTVIFEKCEGKKVS